VGGGSLFDVDTRGRAKGGWNNKLVWGDNKLILSSLANGPMREEIEKNGGIKLIYIDPPFDVGADFSLDIEIGEGDKLTKQPSVIEEIAYRDTWGKGQNSYLSMIYERLMIMRDLLADDGSIYVHIDWRVSGVMRMVLDEVFGKDNFVNEIVWCYKSGGAGENEFAKKHDTIFFYKKSDKYMFNSSKEKSYMGIGYSTGNKNVKLYDDNDDRGPYTLVNTKDWWSEIGMIATSKGRLYPTEKPEALLERIIEASSNKNDLVADFFCGSGTALAVAEKLGRKWIGTDLGKFGIHTTRKRMIGVQRELKKENKPFRAFEILNLGKYERQYYVQAIRDADTTQDKLSHELDIYKQFSTLILDAYKAVSIDTFQYIKGYKGSVFIAVARHDEVVTYKYCEDVLKECQSNNIHRVEILSFDYEQSLVPNIQDVAKQYGVELSLKYVPRDVFDKRAVDKGQVVFYDVAFIEANTTIKGNDISVELTDYNVYYTTQSEESILQSMTNKDGAIKNGSRVEIINGQVVKTTAKDGIITNERLTKHWTDWIDYWAIDWNWESRKMIENIEVEEYNEGLLTEDGAVKETKYETIWNKRYVFENEWQTYRTKKNRTLELNSSTHTYDKQGNYKIAIKVVDIFGNDTLKIIDVNI
jgi:DNA modification methylase